ncbi:MAG: hypothetical protein ABSF34_12090 [Verrucomicrobiota bacterium]
MIKSQKSKVKAGAIPINQNKPAPVTFMCASDMKQTASFAKPGVDVFAIRAQIAKWSLLIQSGEGEKKGFISPLEPISQVAYCVLHEILHLAESGHKNATEELYKILAVFINGFDELCHKNPDVFEPTARKMVRWPALISPHSDTKKRNEKLIGLLNLGVDSGLNLDGKQWSLKTPEVGVALCCHEIIEKYRQDYLPENIRRRRAQIREINKMLGRPPNYQRPISKPIPLPPEAESKLARDNKLMSESRELSKTLKPLNRQNYSDWFKASWPYFLMRYGDDFENRKCFSHYWKSGAFKETDPENLSKRRLTKSARGDIRHAIKKQIKQAFRSIAPKSVPVG